MKRLTVFFLLAAALAGCGTGIHIIPEKAFVMPAADTRRFQVHATVANYDNKESQFIMWVKLHAEYFPMLNPKPGQAPCVLDSVQSISFLQAGQQYHFGPEDIIGHNPGDLGVCICVQFQCEGFIDITLLQGNTPETREQISGADTSIEFTWIPSGDPNDPHERWFDNSIIPSN
jgi:hypothetical protein